MEAIPVQVSDDVTVMVEAANFGGEEDVGVGDLLSFEGVTNALEAVSSALAGTLKKVKPDKAKIEFGLKIGLESGKLTTLIVQNSGEANLKITLEWGSAANNNDEEE